MRQDKDQQGNDRQDDQHQDQDALHGAQLPAQPVIMLHQRGLPGSLRYVADGLASRTITAQAAALVLYTLAAECEHIAAEAPQIKPGQGMTLASMAPMIRRTLDPGIVRDGP